MVLCCKFFTISYVWPATPYWDEWSAEAAGLYKMYDSGGLSLKYLLSGHNEHRILTTRLLHLLTLELNGLWNPLLNIAVNAIIQSLNALLVFRFLYINNPAGWVSSLLLCLTAFGFPISPTNLLWGFQAQFHLNILFGLLSILFFSKWSIESSGAVKSFAFGYILFLFCCFSLAGGALVGVAIVGAFIFRAYEKRSLGSRVFGSTLLILATFVVFVLTVPKVEGHKLFKVQSATQVLYGACNSFSWPFPQSLPNPILLSCAIFLHLPALTFFYRALMNRGTGCNPDSELPLIMIYYWGVVQSAAIVYGRYNHGLRWGQYLDVYLLFVIINVAWMFKYGGATTSALRGLNYKTIWLIIVGSALLRVGTQVGWREAEAWKTLEISRGKSAKAFLVSRDYSSFQSLSIFERGYPDAKVISDALSDPAVQARLPQHLQSDPTIRGRFDSVIDSMLRNWWIPGTLALIPAVALLLKRRTPLPL